MGMRFPGVSATEWRKIRREIFRRSAARFASLSAVHALAGVATICRPSGPRHQLKLRPCPPRVPCRTQFNVFCAWRL